MAMMVGKAQNSAVQVVESDFVPLQVWFPAGVPGEGRKAVVSREGWYFPADFSWEENAPRPDPLVMAVFEAHHHYTYFH
ncbi:unnamed protein product, partial [marine sediment metagenome]